MGSGWSWGTRRKRVKGSKVEGLKVKGRRKSVDFPLPLYLSTLYLCPFTFQPFTSFQSAHKKSSRKIRGPRGAEDNAFNSGSRWLLANETDCSQAGGAGARPLETIFDFSSVPNPDPVAAFRQDAEPTRTKSWRTRLPEPSPGGLGYRIWTGLVACLIVLRIKSVDAC